MSKQNLRICLLLAGGILLAAMTLITFKKAAPSIGEPETEPHKEISAQEPLKNTAGVESHKIGDSTAGIQEEKTPRDNAVDAWESMLAEVIDQKNVSTTEQAKSVKDAFDRLDKADQSDCIHEALNLFPDERFPALYGILFDKSEDPDVLDAIFSDALNRPEEIKMPLLKTLRKDREHPMFFESARILDVVDPEEGKKQ